MLFRSRFVLRWICFHGERETVLTKIDLEGVEEIIVVVGEDIFFVVDRPDVRRLVAIFS